MNTCDMYIVEKAWPTMLILDEKSSLTMVKVEVELEKVG